MLVAVITQEKANDIQGTEFVNGQLFNPIEYEGRMIVSLVEAQYLSVTDIVEIIKHIPKEDESEISELQ